MSSIEISFSKSQAILVKNILLNHASASVNELQKIGEVIHQLESELGRMWDEKHDQNAKCTCGHPYYRHFDSWEDNLPVGCKYCECGDFDEPVTV